MDFLYSGLVGKERKKFRNWKKVELEGDEEYGSMLEVTKKRQDSLLKAIEAIYENRRAQQNKKLEELVAASRISFYHKARYAGEIHDLLNEINEEHINHVAKVREINSPFKFYDDSDRNYLIFGPDSDMEWPTKEQLEQRPEFEDGIGNCFEVNPLENDDY